MPHPAQGRLAGAPPQAAQQQQQQQQPQGQQQQAQQGQGQTPPLSLLIGVAVQAALFWSADDPSRPPWSAEAEQALRGIFEQMPQRV